MRLFLNFLVVGLGGALGSMARFGTSYLIGKGTDKLYLATLAVNLAGCLLIGILYGLGTRVHWLQGMGWLLLAGGFCGGFTTFSTFALDNMTLMEKHMSLTAISYTILSVILGLFLCRLGINLAR